MTDVDFSIRVHAYEQAPSLQKFDFQPMGISFEFVRGKAICRDYVSAEHVRSA